MALIFDLEADGLLETFTKIHCLVVHDSETKAEYKFVGHDEIRQGVDLLLAAPIIVAHNGIKYDVPVLEQTFGVKFNQSTIRDTLTIARLIFADCYDRDCTFVRKGMKLDKDLYGRHSLKAWGQRIGMHKGEYTGGWEEFNEEMLAYCCNDVAVTNKLYRVLDNLKYSHNALVLEHRVTWIIARQERYGFYFDTPAATDFCFKLLHEQEEAHQTAVDGIGYLCHQKHPGKQFVPKRDNKKLGYVAGGAMSKIEYKLFNPSSYPQIGRILTSQGWEPKVKTPKGKPKLDEDGLDDAVEFLEQKELELGDSTESNRVRILLKYLMLTKRLGFLLTGKNSCLNLVTKENRIHGSVNTNGAVTGRATHAKPNISGTPKKGKPYGEECRALFIAPPGKVLVGADLAALELRCLAHFMHPYDDGEYGRLLLEGDIHTANQEAAGLPTRDNAKTFIYGFLYGAGSEKIGRITNSDETEGKRLKRRFLEKFPALARVLKDIASQVESRGYLIGLDGRKLKIRSKHAALNTLLQSAGALISKQSLVYFDEFAVAVGRNRCQQVAWIHDEIQAEVDPEIAHDAGKAAVESFERAGRHFKFNLPITGTYTVGKTWRDTH